MEIMTQRERPVRESLARLDAEIAAKRARIDAGYLLYTQARRGNEVAFRLFEELFGPVAA